MQQYLSGIAALSAVVVSLLSLFANRIWAKKDKSEEKAEQHNNAIVSTLKNITTMIDELSKKLDLHIIANEESNATQLRTGIIRFDDELLLGVKHTKSHFDTVLIDIDHYNEYCEAHPNFKNGVAASACSHILEVYEECKHNHTFL